MCFVLSIQLFSWWLSADIPGLSAISTRFIFFVLQITALLQTSQPEQVSQGLTHLKDFRVSVKLPIQLVSGSRGPSRRCLR